MNRIHGQNLHFYIILKKKKEAYTLKSEALFSIENLYLLLFFEGSCVYFDTVEIKQKPIYTYVYICIVTFSVKKKYIYIQQSRDIIYYVQATNPSSYTTIVRFDNEKMNKYRRGFRARLEKKPSYKQPHNESRCKSRAIEPRTSCFFLFRFLSLKICVIRIYTIPIKNINYINRENCCFRFFFFFYITTLEKSLNSLGSVPDNRHTVKLLSNLQ